MRVSLLPNGALSLIADSSCAAIAYKWVPHSAQPWVEEDVRGPIIAVVTRESDQFPSFPTAPQASLGTVRAWNLGQDRIELADDVGALRATLSLDKYFASIEVDVNHPAASVSLHSALTLSAALLLGRCGATLMHAGAIEHPSGGAWLVVGDARTGKTSTCAGLLSTGWHLLADDHIVLCRGERKELTVYGWPRAAHLDVGWERAQPTGVRELVNLFTASARGSSQNVRIKGVVFPRVAADRPTRSIPISASDAFARLIRQSPWLMLDPPVAASLTTLLGQIASLPVYELRLGTDTFANGYALSTQIPEWAEH